ncbi:MAG: 3-methyl-2-oxobutanoate hydroxymethyltransferase [Bacteroidetes bacterium]|nr:MAG: 3-methyl-2-oxobutanoate hydroxymethyltransferase [Bacteroidota bacterium]
MSAVKKEIRKITTHVLRAMKEKGVKISMLTAYDFSFARILDDAGVDVVLVGDSASNVVHGHETTLPITLEQMIDHASAVVRAVKRALVIVDLPFGYYQGDSKNALKSAIRIMKESGAHGIKMEGGEFIAQSVHRIVSAGIPVMGHLGLMPQSIYKYGTYAVRAREEDEAQQLLDDAHSLEKAGSFALVLEKIPRELATRISSELSIPTIGIGAGGGCDGQVLVTHDMLGLNNEFSPRFLRRYANLYDVIREAVAHYIEDVKSHDFPNEDEAY